MVNSKNGNYLIFIKMKKNNLILMVFVCLTVLISCIKDITPTSLEITVQDNSGNIVSGASVKLYSSISDWTNATNQIGATQYSDASGKVEFTGLSNIKYYWYVEKDCQNNFNGTNTTASALVAEVTNLSSVVISGTGTLKLVSNSSYPYSIYINGTYAFDMNGGTTDYEDFMPTGYYTIRVLQVSGYSGYPTDETFTGTLGCGATLTTTFP